MQQKIVTSVVVLVFFALLGHRVWRANQFDRPMPNGMPETHRGTDDEYRQLYLVPAGAYTRSDIRTNGNQTPRQRYASFQAEHDFNPRPGDRICPISRTKANVRCTWDVGGQTYQFCCPPCIDEFVRLAKQQPDQIRPPDEYTHR